MSNTLVWFRQDLRVADNTALSLAAENSATELYGLYIATPEQWRQHDMAPIRERFIYRQLTALAQSLAQLNIPLLYLQTPTFAEVPDLLAQLVSGHGFDAVFANREYGWNEKQRDNRVADQLGKLGRTFSLHHDQGMLAPGLTTQTGKPYTVFTPFKKRWLEHWRSIRPGLRPTPARRKPPPAIESAPLPQPVDHPADSAWPTGETGAAGKLESFCETCITDYKSNRDLPAIAGTSTLSPWLAAGVISPRQCLLRAVTANEGRLAGGQEGIDTWISELIWRDFYIHILDSYPAVSKNRAFRTATESIRWRQHDEDFQAWCEGRTGIPIIDAAMRQLLQTGWMHNRLRMIVAMFLSKQLLLDWRRGERFFMQHLIDGHLASNNGGWQWAASTGTDAAPYFRIFNPVTQSQRFDPQGTFIRHYVPELRHMQGKDIHLPPPLIRAIEAPDYPAPIVHLKSARERALAAHRECR